SDRSRSAARRLSYLHLSLWPGRAKQMEANLRKLAHSCGRDRPVQKRYSYSYGEIAPPRINRQRQRPRDSNAASSRSPSLAQMNVAAVVSGQWSVISSQWSVILVSDCALRFFTTRTGMKYARNAS